MELAVLLPAATEAATIGERRCYMELSALLPALLPAATEAAIIGDGRCYMELAVLLLVATGVATTDGSPCYYG
jgi:ABC-type phosphate transport system permease subunit